MKVTHMLFPIKTQLSFHTSLTSLGSSWVTQVSSIKWPFEQLPALLCSHMTSQRWRPCGCWLRLGIQGYRCTAWLSTPRLRSGVASPWASSTTWDPCRRAMRHRYRTDEGEGMKQNMVVVVAEEHYRVWIILQFRQTWPMLWRKTVQLTIQYITIIEDLWKPRPLWCFVVVSCVPTDVWSLQWSPGQVGQSQEEPHHGRITELGEVSCCQLGVNYLFWGWIKFTWLQLNVIIVVVKRSSNIPVW